MKLLWTTIYVNNMEESLDFYEKLLGMKVSRRFQPDEGMDIAFLDGSGAELELICREGSHKVTYNENASLGLQVDSVDRWLNDFIKRKIKTSGQIVSPTPGIKFFFAYDPNGFPIELVELT